jgi:hypothetical protein
MNAVHKVHYVHHSPLPEQLAHTLHDSWTALSKGRQYGTPFPASTYASQSKPFQADQAGDGRGLASSYTWSLAKPYKGIYYPASGTLFFGTHAGCIGYSCPWLVEISTQVGFYCLALFYPKRRNWFQISL